MSRYVKYDLGNVPNSVMFSIYVWACDNVEIEATNIPILYEKHSIRWAIFRFDNDEDAVAFKLRWV